MLSRGNASAALERGRGDVLPAQKRGKMRVVLNVHGGQQGLADVLEGLVIRNARAVREGAAKPWTDGIVKADAKARAWYDAPMAQQEGYASGKTAAAWFAGTLRAAGRRGVRLGFRNGSPAVYENGRLLKVFSGDLSKLGVAEGRSDERLVLMIDDDEAKPVREINQAIAVHNAKRIKAKGLPPLYRSGVRYKTEGSPELWWDAEEILRNGHDDCEGLAAYRAGELMLRGYDARVHARLVKVPDPRMGGSGKGGRLFHAVVKVWNGPDGRPVVASDGTPVYDDPSMRLGMPVPEWYQKFAAGMRAEGRDL